MTPSWRKPVGMLGILLFIGVWIAVVASFSPVIGALPALVQLVIYVIAGVIWIAPLRPVLAWMETGRFRP